MGPRQTCWPFSHIFWRHVFPEQTARPPPMRCSALFRPLDAAVAFRARWSAREGLPAHHPGCRRWRSSHHLRAATIRLDHRSPAEATIPARRTGHLRPRSCAHCRSTSWGLTLLQPVVCVALILPAAVRRGKRLRLPGPACPRGDLGRDPACAAGLSSGDWRVPNLRL